MRRENRFRERLEDGDVAVGARAATFSSAVIEAYGHLGLDFAWLDFEHTGPSPYDAGAFEDLTRAAEAGGTDLLVRLSSGDPALIRKVLDAGVRTVLVPRVETADEVEAAVAASRFTYGGEPGDRGVGAGRSGGWGDAPADHPDREDAAVTVGAMIENRTAVENLEEILAVPELGFVFVGPADLSVSLGVPYETDAPVVREHVDRIVRGATAAGVPVGGIRNDAEAAAAAVEEGYQLLRVGGEIGAARTLLGERLASIRDRVG